MEHLSLKKSLEKIKTMLNRTSLFILFFMTLCGCSISTTIKSSHYSDLPRNSYSKLLVEAYTNTPKENLDMEWMFRDVLGNDKKVSIIPSTDIFPPYEKISLERRRKKISSDHIDGVLLVGLRGLYNHGIDPSRDGFWQSLLGQKNINTSLSDIPLTEGEYELILLDAKLGFKPVWIGFAETMPDFLSPMNTPEEEAAFLKSLAKGVRKKLLEDGLIGHYQIMKPNP
ncbi:MAG: hypothetical protein IPJ69_00230 [Deltaproteobacteria bacterium]|nr:MAG: hypothetical protein IPJ69_00230 [Deltaproteobacteria bacterium]